MEIILNLDRVNDILALRKSEQLLLFKLLKIAVKDNEDNNLIILEQSTRISIADELNVQVLSLNATMSRLIKKNILTRRTNSVYVIDKSLFKLI